MTTYIVLRYISDTEQWDKYGESDASSPSRAIRLLEPGAGEFVAVPKRSWNPVTVKVENTVKITIG